MGVMKRLLAYTFLFAVAIGCAVPVEEDIDDFGQWENEAGECGWAHQDWFGEAYYCDGEYYEDPKGNNKRECPHSSLYEGLPCRDVKGVGCCDANGDLWFCSPGDRLDKQSCGE